MGKFLALLFCMNIFLISAFGQNNYELSGLIVDEQNQPLEGASVVLAPVGKGTITNGEGEYAIDGLKKGTYIVKISYVGYATEIDTIRIAANKVHNAQLSDAQLNLQEVVITSDYVEIRKKETSLNIEIVNDDYLKQNLGGSLMKSLERLPGVTTIDIGSGQSKPVIRGLGFNRVVVVENGIKHEAQQWGTEHGLEIDQYALDNVEVIKGPASLMFGSDAIGGVVDIKNNNVPADNTFGATVDLSGKSNNNSLGTSLLLFGRKDWFYAELRATWLEYGDYKVPTDSVDIYSYRAPLHENHLRNTAGKEHDLHLSFGIIKPKFQSKFQISTVNSKSGFFANTHGLEPRNVDNQLHDKSARDIHYPYHQVNHFKVINNSRWKKDQFKLEADLGFQHNFRQEWSQYVDHGYMPAVFPDTMNFDADLERQFEKYVYSGTLKATYNQNDRNIISIGVNAEYQDNKIDGRGFIIPAFEQFSTGGFLFAKHKFSEKNILQLGVRYDYGTLDTHSYHDWFPSPVFNENDTTLKYLKRAEALNLRFSNISWSLGYNHNADNWSFRANIGKSFRMPIAKELAANGINYHHFSYEVGNADLSPEISYQLDAGIEWNRENYAMSFTPFINYFANYIYLNPSSEYDRLYGNSNQKYYYTQSKVFRYGGEFHAHYNIIKPLQLGVIGEYVYSEQLSGKKKGFTLPFSPPPSAILNVKYQKQWVKFIQHSYISVDYRVTAPQNNIVPPEETTDGYQVINLGLGGEVKLNNQKMKFSFQIQNLLDKEYFNHTSYYRLINVPEPGRNFILNLTIPFSGKMNKNN